MSPREIANPFPVPRRRARAMLVVACVAASFATSALATPPVEFIFRAVPRPGDPFGRDVWAEVTLPSGKALRLPAYFRPDGNFAVRARAVETGDYRLGDIFEKSANGEMTKIASEPVNPSNGVARANEVVRMHQVGVTDGDRPRKFVLDDGTPFQPVGANLAWVQKGSVVPFYKKAARAYQDSGLNWMRIWMTHWGHLNLDWRDKNDPPPLDVSPVGTDIAENWDKIIESAEDSGVYIQLVFQHHGQYSTKVNSNWRENPWNATNMVGGLKSPGEFFTSPMSRYATTRKYRYIVARWGYSPAIMAWELFNEVHWTDPINIDRDEKPVAEWHALMAGRIRSFDAYHHLITTSTESLRSDIYSQMDYLQPHLYPLNALAAVRTFETAPARLDGPVFYGEVGDDHMDLSEAQKKSGVAIVPPVWASLMGVGRYAAQPWLGWDLIDDKRLDELGAVARFVNATGIGARDGLQPFSAVVESDRQVPFKIQAAQVWQHRPSPDVDLALDGRVTLGMGEVPSAFVTRANHDRDNFPWRVVYSFDAPHELNMSAEVTGVGMIGGTLKVSSGENVLVEKTWPSDKNLPARLDFKVPAGRQTLTVENSGIYDWIGVPGIDTGLKISALASVGKRDDRFIACWVWNRDGVFSVKNVPPVKGTLDLAEVPAGKWTVTWWDTFSGKAAAATTVNHTGGVLRIPTPPISRHAAVVLGRAD